MSPQAPRGQDGIGKALGASRTAVVSTAVFSLIINLLMLTGPLFMLQVYDRVLTSGSVPTLMALVMLVCILYGLYGFLEFIRARVMMRVGRSLDENLRARVFDIVSLHALKGDPKVRLTPVNDLLTLRQFLSGPGPFSFFDMPWAPIYLAVIFMLHPVLGFASTAAVLLLGVLAIINNRLIREPAAEAHKAVAQAQVISEESLRNAELASVLGMTDNLRERWSARQQEALDAQTEASDRGGLVSVTSRTLRLVFQSGILALGALLAIQQEISPGAMIAASIIMARALAPVEQAVAHWQAFMAFRSAWSRLSMLIRQTPELAEPMPLPNPTGAVEAQGLTAFAPESDKPIIYNINFAIEPGTGLGIIGPTGAGKSTLARALVGAWPRIKGKVQLDGADIRQWNPVMLGRHVGYLPQEVELFEGTLAENISRFMPDAEPDAIVAAAKQAAVHDMIVRLPEGYNTRVGAGGRRLSAGQLQRIGLARAMYGDPTLIILDEPNANLDAEGEAALVQAVMNARRRGATVIVVAHRPSALAAIDMLLMMKDGQQVAFGPKDEVLAKVLNQRVPSAAPAAAAAGAGGPRGQGHAMSMSGQVAMARDGA
ncbi:MAG: type I secretion system permease/ATPase [Anderseniella sp.]|jgi:ATP-binding cassette subfamily C protein|nr:type I secretion system permease/ATPase [Anderseniella sp.]